MVARAGRLQVAFNAGEIGPRFDQRTSSKNYAGGLKTASRIELLPQGGFSLAAGLRLVGDTDLTASRTIPFASLDGSIYDLVLTDNKVEVWTKTEKIFEFVHGYAANKVSQILYAQDSDTLLLFHEDYAPWRILHGGPTTWVTSDAPLSDVPNHDYGAVYTNGTASEFELQFIGFHQGNTPYWDNIVFTISVNGQETTGIRGASTVPPSGTVPNMTLLATNVLNAILALPNVQPGVTCVVTSSVDPFRLTVKFTGTDNLGDNWALAGRVVNKADAAVLVNKIVVGISPGEPIISALRGWPRCGVFYQQRLILGGFRSFPNGWMASIVGRPFDFDQRLSTPDGAFVVPLNIPGGERVENIVNNQFLLVMTSENNFWVAGSTQGLSKTSAPKHVPATDHGVASHVPIVTNEGAAIYVHKSGDFIGEMRYTDVDGHYNATDLSLFAYHLVHDVIDIAIKRKQANQSANMAAIVNRDGLMLGIFLLREQDLTGFSRLDTAGLVKACAVNNRNELTVIVERARGVAVARTVERQEDGLLLDCAVNFSFPIPVCDLHGLDTHEGQEVWALADGHVLGPFEVSAGRIELSISAKEITVGRWLPPKAETLPIARMVGPDIWLQKKSRIHTVQLFVEDTTSIAIACNGGKTFDVNLSKYGQVPDVPELQSGVTGLIKLSGFAGFVDEPNVIITQVRPGRMTVKSIIVEAAI